ncbi:MAG: glycosyltransferase family 2 protein [Planctomycetes bacterium]|nr:glycosyltransferase family 2 protein [Planctomycetota bacterium]MCP4770754.1 glycosyltransferase family 2 protein [Planctomycetota bacterium]MCP4862175.1 glycosyltransferase family 2 protein [Planctomycetota bacterium]
MPKVSVLVAAFDAAASIVACLTSIQRQSFEDWQCVVVDDGSTDGTAALVQELAALDPRLQLLQRPHQGVVTARNVGIDLCRGEFIAIMDADDFMLPERLAAQLQAFEQTPSLAAVGTKVCYLPRTAVSPGRLEYERWLNSQRSADDLRRERYIEMPVGHPTLMLRASALKVLRYRDMGWPEDWDLLLRLFDLGAEVGIVPQVLHHWQLDESSLSQHSPSYTIEAFACCRANFLADGFLRDVEHYALMGYGNTGKRLRKDLRALGKHCHLISELHPARIGQVIDGAPVVHHDELQDHSIEKMLISVAGMEERESIRKLLKLVDLVEEVDFIFAA